MIDGTIFYVFTQNASDLARSALPNAPVVEDRESGFAAAWLASRLATSRLLRWLADVTEPAQAACRPSHVEKSFNA
jgi:hypothetical protein